MPPTKPKLIMGRTDANTFKFSLRMEHASLTGEVSIAVDGGRPDQRAVEEKRKLLFQRLGALALAFGEGIRDEAAAARH
jgi:hypothetical protein